MAEGLGVSRQQRSSGLQISHILSVPPVSSNQYPYQPLDTSCNEIRLLHRSASFQVDDLISCTLSHVSLDLDPKYEALSYTWCDSTGSAQLNKEILIDGHVVAVTCNLEAALRQLLMIDQNRMLWVDALCINQTDVTERNEQVSKMKVIYQLADSVVTWLGEEYNDSREAFKLLKAFREVGVIQSIYAGPEPWTPAMTIPNEIVQRTHAIVNLWGREYWKRVWIIQEIAFARRVVLHCGTDYMTLEEMKSACDAVHKDFIRLAQAFVGSTVGHKLWLLKRDGPNLVVQPNYNISNEEAKLTKLHDTRVAIGNGVTLSRLLIQHRIKKASDPRDKVYSLLGMVSAEKQNRIPVDYNLDTRTVFQNVATFIATEELDLLILAENKTPRIHSPDLDRGFCLPSWVPNWANAHPADTITIGQSAPWVSASGTSIAKVLIRDSDILCVEGIRIGSITRVGKLLPDFHVEEINFGPVFDVLYDWWLIFHSAGRSRIVGEQGFVDFLFFGKTHQSNSFTREQIEPVEKEIVDHLRIAISIYKPDDETLIPILGKQEVAVDDNMRRQAEVDLWGVAPMCRKRRMFLMNGDKCGIGPQDTQEGDLVVVVLGCRVPLVLRKRTEGGGGGYLNIGDAYVDGFIKGEAVKDLKGGKCRSESFELH